MASFILIHGSWHGGWCFDEVRALLEAEGHEVIAPDLPGMGASDEEMGKISLQGWADFAADLCRSASQEPVVLAGHSRGGIVVTQAAETAPDAVDALVYICAMMLPDGMSRADFKAHEVKNPLFDELISPTSGGHGTVITGEAPERVFAQLSPRELVEPAMKRLVAEPHGPRSEPMRTTPERFGSVPRHYILCSEDQTIPLSSQKLMQELVPGAELSRLETDHSPFLSTPRELAEILLAVAAGKPSPHPVKPTKE